MNTLDIIIILIIGISVLNGVIRGFIKTLFGLTSLIIVVGLTWMFTPVVSELVINETSFDEMISEKVVELLNVEDMMTMDLDTTAAVQQLNDLSLPGNVIESLVENYTPQIIEGLKAGGIGDYIGSSLSIMAVNALTFIILFTIVSLLLNALVTLLDLIARLPVLKQMNRIGGFGIGLLIGVVVIWVGCLALSFAISIQSTSTISNLIESSILGRLFYYNNPLQNFVMNLDAVIK